jgi:hypothetical protein
LAVPGYNRGKTKNVQKKREERKGQKISYLYSRILRFLQTSTAFIGV